MGKQIWKPGTMIYPVPAVMVSCGKSPEVLLQQIPLCVIFLSGLNDILTKSLKKIWHLSLILLQKN